MYAIPQFLLEIVVSYADLAKDLTECCIHGDLESAQELWKLGITLQDLRRNHTFREACYRNQIRAAKWIWSLGMTIDDVREPNTEFMNACNTPIQHAIDRCHEELAKWLWSLGLDTSDLRRGASGLWGASARGHLPIIKWVWVLQGFTLDDVRRYGIVIISACESGHTHILDWLWEIGFSMDDLQTPTRAHTPLGLSITRTAAIYSNQVVIDYLRKKGYH